MKFKSIFIPLFVFLFTPLLRAEWIHVKVWLKDTNQLAVGKYDDKVPLVKDLRKVQLLWFLNEEMNWAPVMDTPTLRFSSNYIHPLEQSAKNIYLNYGQDIDDNSFLNADEMAFLLDGEKKEEKNKSLDIENVISNKAQSKKVDRETENKKRGDELLSSVYDELIANKAKNVKTFEKHGFFFKKESGTPAIVIYRKMVSAEMKEFVINKGIVRSAGHDSYKWFTESSSHSLKFHNKSVKAKKSEAIVGIVLNLEGYITFRNNLKQEYGQKAASDSRYHQENLGQDSTVVNIGVHPSDDEAFNALILKIVQ